MTINVAGKKVDVRLKPRDKVQKSVYYDYQPPTSTAMPLDKEDKDVIRALRVMQEGEELFLNRKEEVLTLWEAYIAGRKLREPEGKRFILGSVIYDAIQAHIEQEDFHKYELKITDRLDDVPVLEQDFISYKEQHIKQYFEEALSSGGLFDAYEGKNGVREARAVQGDAFVYLSVDKPGKRFPFTFHTLRLSQVRLPASAVRYNDLTEMVLVFDRPDYDDFRKDFSHIDPAELEKVKWGVLPYISDDLVIKDFENKDGNKEKRRPGQFAIYFNLEEPCAVWIGGSNAHAFHKVEGADFLWRDEDENPMFPVRHQVFRYSPGRQFYNIGLADQLYQENNLQELNENNKVHNAKKATRNFPIVTTQNKNQLMQDMADAAYEDDQGNAPVLFDEVQPGQSGTSSVNLIGAAAAGLNETSFLDDLLNNRLGSAGVKLQRTEGDKGQPYSTFALEVENSLRPVRRTIKHNAEEYQRLLVLAYKMLMMFGDPADKEKVDNSDIELVSAEDGITYSKLPRPTYGEVNRMMRKTRVRIKVDEKSGILPNSILEINKLNAAVAAATGTTLEAFVKRKLLKQYGIVATEAQLQSTIPPEQRGARGQNVQPASAQASEPVSAI